MVEEVFPFWSFELDQFFCGIWYEPVSCISVFSVVSNSNMADEADVFEAVLNTGATYGSYVLTYQLIIFWVLTSCRNLEWRKHFRENCCLHATGPHTYRPPSPPRVSKWLCSLQPTLPMNHCSAYVEVIPTPWRKKKHVAPKLWRQYYTVTIHNPARFQSTMLRCISPQFYTVSVHNPARGQSTMLRCVSPQSCIVSVHNVVRCQSWILRCPSTILHGVSPQSYAVSVHSPTPCQFTIRHSVNPKSYAVSAHILHGVSPQSYAISVHNSTPCQSRILHGVSPQSYAVSVQNPTLC